MQVMAEQPDAPRHEAYEWTPSRLLLALVILAVGAAFVGVMAWRELQPAATAAGSLPPRARQVSTRPKLNFNLDNLMVPPDQILFGGPAKDGIPALSDPEVVPVADADFLHPNDRVVGVRIGRQQRAYPLRVLIWHEAVNDQLGGVPIAVIYCPLCDSVSVVDRRLDGRTYEFGISGLLVNSNVLLYDRTDDALWSQVGFTAISGPNAGKSLRHLPWELTTFAAWRKANPTGAVVSFNTGYDRDYANLPYEDYFQTDQLRFPVAREDLRLGRRELIVGVKLGETARAYPVREIQTAPDGVVRDTINGETIVLQADAASGSVRIVQAPERALVVYTYWFAWAAFHSQTEIYAR